MREFFPAPRVLLITALIALGLISLRFAPAVPKWDSGDYYQCIAASAGAEANPGRVNCENHNSFAYLSLLSLPARWGLVNVEWVYALNMLLFVLSILAYREILRTVFPHESASEILGVVAIYALTPAVVANVFFINLDFGVLCFFVFTLLFLLKRNVICAALSGAAMLFTKETGVFLYLVILGAYALVFFAGSKRSIRDHGRELGLAAVLLVPFVPLARRMLHVYHATNGARVWYSDPQLKHTSFWQMAFDFRLAEPHFVRFVTNIFVLNFHWLLTLPICAYVLAIMLRWLMKRPLRMPRCAAAGDLLFLLLVALGATYVVTRFRPFCNVRYVIATFPLLFLFGYLALRELCRHPAARAAYLGFAIICLGMANFFSCDPLSRLAYGTVGVGEHRLYDMLSIYPERQAYLDSFVYNTQHLVFDDLAEQAFADIRPTDRTLFLVAPGGNLYWPGALDSRTFRRTVSSTAVVRPMVTRDIWQITKLRGNNRKFYFLALPAVENAPVLARLCEHYQLIGRTEYSRDGYAMDVYSFVAAAPQG